MLWNIFLLSKQFHERKEDIYLREVLRWSYCRAKDDSSVDLADIKNLYERVISKDETCVSENNSFQNLSLLVEESKTELRRQSRTAKLWLQCGDLPTLHSCSRAADWELNLFSTGKMLNLFATTCHVHYAKCSTIYLHMTVNLEHTHSWLYQRFTVKGSFVARGSERFWTCLWPDLSIEQIMMRAPKSHRGLTRIIMPLVA